MNYSYITSSNAQSLDKHDAFIVVKNAAFTFRATVLREGK